MKSRVGGGQVSREIEKIGNDGVKGRGLKWVCDLFTNIPKMREIRESGSGASSGGV